ncbi:UNVERIFIED_ORG: hypothetical protein LHK14_01655 [Roseateles sp. XES5]|nr:hypothetical protein [Roseateles sp. XES5]
MMPDLNETELCGIVESLVKDAERYRDSRSAERIKAMTFFDGDAKEMQAYIPADEGRSKVVSRDVRAAVKKVLPSICRTILGNDEIVEYQPVGEGDEDKANQASDYINHVVLPECKGRQAIEDAINDALRLRNGILKWWQCETVDVKVSLHTGLDEMSFAQLVAAEDVDVLAHTQRTETIDTPQGPQSVGAHDVKIRRRITTGRPRLAAIAPENWLIHPDAISLEDSPVLGENCRLRRSELVKMGYDRDRIWAIAAASSGPGEQEAEADTRRRDSERDRAAPQRALEEIDYYDLLVRIDQDGDGIAELRRMVFAGGIKPECLLENTEWDEINYADIVSERRPHQWEGNSVPDDVMEIQTVKTVLLRQTLDNLYWQNNLQPIGQRGAIENPEAVMNPSFGLPIWTNQGVDVRAAVGYSAVPMVADKSFAMLAYLDAELTDRTGISDAASGLAPDALQNMTARATALVEQAGIGQTEMMVRTIANSLAPVFGGLLKLIIQHQDRPRTVRLRDRWVTFDPRTWNADMDVVVNVGLGAGTRERDMMAMQQVIGLQERILASMGPAVGMNYVTPQNLYNAMAQLIEASGLRSVNLYLSQPDPQAIQQALQGQPEPPSPDEAKMQAAMALEDKRGQIKLQIEQARAAAKAMEYDKKMQADALREREQRDADLETNLAEMEREALTDRQKIDADLAATRLRQETEREWMAIEAHLLDRKLAAESRRQAMHLAGHALQGDNKDRSGHNG